VAEALARLERPPEARIYGPATDPEYAAGLPPGLLAGALPPGEVPGVLAGARALVMGSTWPENAPLIALEARAAGCPVIAPAIGGLPELVEHGVDGLLYPPGDAAALAAAIERAGREAFPVRPPLAFEDHLDRLEGIYRRLLARSG